MKLAQENDHSIVKKKLHDDEVFSNLLIKIQIYTNLYNVTDKELEEFRFQVAIILQLEDDAWFSLIQ